MADTEPSIGNRDNLLEKKIQELLFEANALAAHARQSSAELHRADHLAAAGKTILQVLREHGKLTVPELGRLCGTSRQNVQVVVNRLKAEGWVELGANPAHKRSGLVCLTRQGAGLLDGAIAREGAWLAKLPGAVSQGELAAAAAVLRRVRESLCGEKHQPQRSKPGVREAEPPALPAAWEPEEFPVNLL